MFHACHATDWKEVVECRACESKSRYSVDFENATHLCFFSTLLPCFVTRKPPRFHRFVSPLSFSLIPTTPSYTMEETLPHFLIIPQVIGNHTHWKQTQCESMLGLSVIRTPRMLEDVQPPHGAIDTLHFAGTPAPVFCPLFPSSLPPYKHSTCWRSKGTNSG